jgi:hypothetical protein
MEKIVELFDWIITDKTLRGSKKDDNGYWMSTSPKPLYFCPQTRIAELYGGEKFLIKKETICRALGLDKKSETILNLLPNNIAK